MNQQISNFFTEKIAARIKEKSKSVKDLSDLASIKIEAEQMFLLSNWLPDAARLASKISIESHTAKVSHPDAKTSSNIAECQPDVDGYFRSGNIFYERDVYANGKAINVWNFLNIILDDGRSVLSHLESDSNEIQLALKIPNIDYEQIRRDFLQLIQKDNVQTTSSLVKQVFFPVDDGYHLLSILTSLGISSILKDKVEAIRFQKENEGAKLARKNNLFDEFGYDDLPNVAMISYGGSNPQNISTLNSKNRGLFYFLISVPPQLHIREVRLPAKDFFRNSLRPFLFRNDFIELHELMKSETNNRTVRQQIPKLITRVIDRVLEQVFKIRAFESGWSTSEHYQSLPGAQRIWLDDALVAERESNVDWIDDIALQFSRWIVQTYEGTLKDQRILLSDDELRHIRGFVEDAITNDKEYFK
ncbi:type I-F CRISPR-associated protein Csy1 [Undibacterium danionis]|uniref:Type I-F CRISPR-associated protein Csy1 n=1 Tax=Undibacterium danionis TaxID=1812100 RepID=A0ABV6IJK7_9BURK